MRAGFSVLGDAVNAGEMRDIAEQLGDDYADLGPTATGAGARCERHGTGRSRSRRHRDAGRRCGA